MSKEMKMADVFDGDVIDDADTLMANGYGELADFSGYKRECRYAAHAINNHDSLVDENTALREALRLKEAECEALAHDKSILLSFVKRVSELGIEEWNCEIACDAEDLIEDIEEADDENQQAD